MKRRLYFPIVALCAFLLCFPGCVPESTSSPGNSKGATHENIIPSLATGTLVGVKTNVPGRTQIPTQAETLHSTPILTPQQIILPKATLSQQEVENAIQALLKTNGECQGKCLGGIYPDEMTIQQAVNMLGHWGIVEIYNNPNGINYYYLDQKILDESVRVQLSIGVLGTKPDVIDSMEFFIRSWHTNDFLGKDVWLAHQEAWSGVRFDTIVKTYGIPSYVGYFFRTIGGENSPLVRDAMVYSINVYYDQINFLITISGVGKYEGGSVYLCPSTDSHDVAIEYNAGIPKEKLAEGNPVTWQATTGTDLAAFYQHFNQDSQACTSVSINQIHTLQPWFH
jgi:hypothetical protein